MNLRLLAAVLGLFGFAWVSLSGSLDSQAEEAVDQALKRALVTFAAARGLNAVISVAQGTEVSASPLGIGLTLAPGEVLDPLNDLVERFSSFMLASSVALGTQRVLLEIFAWPPFSLCLIALAAGYLFQRTRFHRPQSGLNHLGKFVLVLLAVRFVVPLAVIGSEWMYSGFLESRHVAAEHGLVEAADQVRAINAERGLGTGEAERGTWDRVKEWAEGARDKASAIVDLEHYSVALEETAKDTIELIVVFLLNTFLFPIALVLLLWHLMKWVLAYPTRGRGES